VNSALLSRLRVFVLQALESDAIKDILSSALKDPDQGLGEFNLEFVGEAEDLLVALAGGDARSALNILELQALKPTADGSEK
jgi:putative ATPase